MSKVLFAVQLPPPVHGASLVNKTLVESEKVIAKYDIDILETQLANSMEDLGDFSFEKIINAFRIFFKLIKKLVFNKYELIYFTLSPLGFAFYKDAVLVLIIKVFSNNKILFHLHGKGIKNELRSSFKRSIYSLVFRKTGVIQLAEVLHDDIKEIYPDTPYFLPNGIIANKRKYVSDRDKKITTFIYLSNLMEEKGVLIFLESIKKLQFIKEYFNVYIVGPSADITTEQANNYISENKLDNVEVVGPIYGEEKYLYLNNSDVFVLPTYYKNECFPLAILEAFQAGLAVISTNNGAIPDMVKNNINGFIVSPKSVEELTEKMKYLIENKGLLQKMKYENRIEFKKKYTENIFIDNFIKIIDQNISNENSKV